jgi:hypothetical protein
MKRSIVLTSIAAFLAACGGESAAVPAGKQRPEAPDRYVTSGGTGISCTKRDPCGSLEAAYTAARAGDIVEVAPGRYPQQVVPVLPKPGDRITFRAAGRGVILHGLDIKADHVALRGMRVSTALDVNSGDPADPVEGVRLYDMHTSTHFILGAKNFAWKGGSIGPSVDAKASMIGGTPASYRLTYDRVTWHDSTRTSGDVHTECLLALGVQGLTIRNSRFTNCAVFDILLSRIGSDPPPRDIVIENTVLEATTDIGGKPAFYSLMTGADPLDGLTLRNNVWGLGLALQGPITNGTIAGNIGRGASCTSGVRYVRNVFTDKRCGSTDRVVPSAFKQFVDPDKGDWRLKTRAAAIDFAAPGSAPARDARGRSRSGRPDAGAFEYRD